MVTAGPPGFKRNAARVTLQLMVQVRTSRVVLRLWGLYTLLLTPIAQG